MAESREQKIPTKMEKVLEKLQEGVKSIFESDKYKEYLRFMSKFHTYSINNQILIYSQMPDATLIAGYDTWKKHHRYVRKGEKAIQIIAPCTYKKEVDDTYADGTVKKDSDGNVRKKTVELKGFKACSVFDMSQTEGDPIPEYISDLTDPVTDYYHYLTAIEQASPMPIRYDDLKGGVHGYYSPVGQEIVINRDMSEMQTLKTLCHEIAHARLDHGSKNDDTDKRTRECQAESTAFVVCNALGLDTSDYSFAYVAGWSSDKEVKELKASLDIIKQASSEMIEDIMQSFEQADKQKKAV